MKIPKEKGARSCATISQVLDNRNEAIDSIFFCQRIVKSDLDMSDRI